MLILCLGKVGKFKIMNIKTSENNSKSAKRKQLIEKTFLLLQYIKVLRIGSVIHEIGLKTWD